MKYSGNEIGKLIKEVRESKRLTQEELATKVKKKRSYISRIEKDGNNLTLKTLIEIVEEGFDGSLKVMFEIK